MADIILSLLFLLLLLIDLMICEFVQLVCETVDLLGVKRLRDWKTENRAWKTENRAGRRTFCAHSSPPTTDRQLT